MIDGAAIVLQARIGSTRLPGKVLARLAGRTVFAHCVERLRTSGLPVILATTEEHDDDVLVAEAERLDVPSVRGSVDDVMSRYVAAAAAFKLSAIIRATADNPAVDLGAALRTLTLLCRTGAGYVVERGMPYGCCVEAMSSDALREAAASDTSAYDREHVTPMLRKHRRFVSLDALAPTELRRPDLRLTIDTAGDLAFVRQVYSLSGAHDQVAPVPLAELIAAADRVNTRARGMQHPGAGVQ